MSKLNIWSEFKFPKPHFNMESISKLGRLFVIVAVKREKPQGYNMFGVYSTGGAVEYRKRIET